TPIHASPDPQRRSRVKARAASVCRAVRAAVQECSGVLISCRRVARANVGLSAENEKRVLRCDDRVAEQEPIDTVIRNGKPTHHGPRPTAVSAGRRKHAPEVESASRYLLLVGKIKSTHREVFSPLIYSHLEVLRVKSIR